MSESINAEFEAYVKAELGDIAVVSEGRFISPKIQNYFKVWSFLEAVIYKLQLENESLKQVARFEADAAAQAIADFEVVKAQLAAVQKDAERYRKLRRGQNWSVTDGIGDTLKAEGLDEAIDDSTIAGEAT
jgi:hypothetical protein